MNIEEGNGHKNDGLEPKYRFGFLLMYEENKQKNHGIETKYRFGFANIYINEINRKIMGLSQSTDLNLLECG